MLKTDWQAEEMEMNEDRATTADAWIPGKFNKILPPLSCLSSSFTTLSNMSEDANTYLKSL